MFIKIKRRLGLCSNLINFMFILSIIPLYPIKAQSQEVSQGSIIKLIDNREEKKEMGVSELKVDGFTYIYLKEICKFYGIKSTYNSKTKEVTLTKDEKSVNIKPNKNEYKLDDKEIKMEAPPIIINGRTAVSPKGMEEILNKMFGSRVVWRASSKKFTVNDEEPVTFWEDHPEESEQQADNKGRELIKPGDILSISVWQRGAFELEELTREREVQEDGRVKFPFVGRITASNSTCPQLEKRLSEMLESYIKNPEVTVTIKQDGAQRTVQIFGEVKRPGTYEFEDRVTLMEAVNRAGGFTEKAKLKEVRVTRFIHHSPYQTDVVNCKLILDQGQRQFDVPVKNKDIVYVPKKKGFLGDVVDKELFKHALYTAVTIIVGMLIRN